MRRLVGWMGSHSLSCAAVVVTVVSISNTHLYSCGIRLLYSRLPKHWAPLHFVAFWFISVVCFNTSEPNGKCVYHLLQQKIILRLKFRVFWDVAPCSHVEMDRRFRGAYCLHHQGDRPASFRAVK
jgi:hypothetical protein